MQKGRFYKIWEQGPKNESTFTTISKVPHARKRQVLSHAFTNRALQSAEEFVIQHVDRWCELLLGGSGHDWSEPRNTSEWIDTLMMDILGDLCFGKSFEIKEPGNNPLKAIPHAIGFYAGFMNPVSPTALSFASWILIWN